MIALLIMVGVIVFLLAGCFAALVAINAKIKSFEESGSID
jgi:uncharacterized protein involved in exopolysaccharide biosynthesis